MILDKSALDWYDNGSGLPAVGDPKPEGEVMAAKADRWVAVYVRVSSDGQDAASQLPDLERWAAAQDTPVKWYKDKFTGRTMDRPGWTKLEADLRAGKVQNIVVWRLDRLGRTARGLTALFADLQERKIGLVSMREGLDLSTPAGRLMAHVLASVAQYETEVRAERIRAGIVAAKKAGKTWGGSKPGHRKVTAEQERVIRSMKDEGSNVTTIARTVGLSRPTVYSVLEDIQACWPKIKPSGILAGHDYGECKPEDVKQAIDAQKTTGNCDSNG